MVAVVWCDQRDGGVQVLGVVPVDESLHPIASCLEAQEAVACMVLPFMGAPLSAWRTSLSASRRAPRLVPSSSSARIFDLDASSCRRPLPPKALGLFWRSSSTSASRSRFSCLAFGRSSTWIRWRSPALSPRRPAHSSSQLRRAPGRRRANLLASETHRAPHPTASKLTARGEASLARFAHPAFKLRPHLLQRQIRLQIPLDRSCLQPPRRMTEIPSRHPAPAPRSQMLEATVGPLEVSHLRHGVIR